MFGKKNKMFCNLSNWNITNVNFMYDISNNF